MMFCNATSDGIIYLWNWPLVSRSVGNLKQVDGWSLAVLHYDIDPDKDSCWSWLEFNALSRSSLINEQNQCILDSLLSDDAWWVAMLNPGRNVRVPGGLAWEDRYEVSSLSRFTRVASWDECLRQCNYTLDSKWLLKPSREPHMQGWKKFPSNQVRLFFSS